LKALGQTGFDQLSKAKTSISSSSVAVAPPSSKSTGASAAAAPKQMVASSNAKVRTIIEFWAEWCGPCKEFAPTFEAVTSKFRDITVQRVNLDENKELASKYSVSSIPRMIMLDASGNAFYNESPPRDPEELTQLIQSHR
jgi:thioredoxin